LHRYWLSEPRSLLRRFTIKRAYPVSGRHELSLIRQRNFIEQIDLRLRVPALCSLPGPNHTSLMDDDWKEDSVRSRYDQIEVIVRKEDGSFSVSQKHFVKRRKQKRPAGRSFYLLTGLSDYVGIAVYDNYACPGFIHREGMPGSRDC